MLSIIRTSQIPTASLQTHTASAIEIRTWDLSQKWLRFRPQSKHELETICTHCRRPDASGYGAQRSVGANTMSHHRSPRTLLPEGVLPQRLPQKPEASRTFLQHARQVCLPGHVRTLPGRNN